MSTLTEPSEAEFRRFHQRTSRRVYGYVRRNCDEAECDDVIAEVFLVAWRRWGQVPADPMPWLLATARRTLANHWRSRNRQERLAAELAGVRDLAGSDPANVAVERADLLRALAGLDPDDREILLLAGWDGLDSAGVATVLGITPVAARARLSRARRRLAARIDEPGTTADPLPSLLIEGS